jgi:type II secretory pathway pseudopilin PulG
MLMAYIMLFIMGSMRPQKILSERAFEGGFTLAEVVAATAVAAILGASLMVGLLTAQRYASSTRALNSARVIVQRNIDTAILQITGTNGVPYNDQSANATDKIPIIVTSGTGSSNTMIEGVLTRTVVAHPNSANAVIRRVTFTIDYNYLGRPFTYSMTTLRAQDNQ